MVNPKEVYQNKLEKAREDLWGKLAILKMCIWYGFEDDFCMNKDTFDQIFDRFCTDIDEEFTKNFSLDLDPEDM